MPTTICPRCQTPIPAQTPYLRIYSTNDDGLENFVRIHLQCPLPAEESPNLASPPSPGMQAMQGGGVSPSASVPRMVKAAAAVGAVVAARRARRR